MSKNTQRAKIIGWSVLVDVAFVVIVFVFRNNMLEWAFKFEQRHLKNTYHLEVQAADIRFASWNSVRLSGLCIKPEGEDTLATIQTIECKPSLLALLGGRLNLNGFTMDSASITMFNDNERNNLSFLSGKNQEGKSAGVKKSSYYARAGNLKDRLLQLMNMEFEISRLHIQYRDTTFAEHIFIPRLSNNRHNLSGLCINQQAGDTLSITGQVIKKDEVFYVNIRHLGNALNYLAFMDAEHGFKCTFDSISAEVKIEEGNGEITASPTVSAHNFRVQHWRLAKGDVIFPNAQFSGKLQIKRESIELDSSSTITLNHGSFKLFASYQTKPDTTFALNIHMPEIPSDTFFNALPVGMFNTLKGISCSGTLAYDLQFFINTRLPDSLIFESQLKRKNFHIIHMGADDYARINEPFMYDACSGDQFIRHIVVGQENPEFTPYSHISPYLPEAIWQSEDPSFMVHRGFVPESFRQSIAQNFKEKRFARGGSTITMQLVKNVFLTRNKTISRKAEEALIVYLIENLGLVPKERMMEVYLNVIEWGPNVYGVSEAARFYFNKKPAELNLQECIFLAAIIPNPKYFRYQFDKQGEIKPYMSDFFKIIVGRLALRGYLNERDTVNFIPRVKLTGPALQQVVPADSVASIIDESLPADE